MSEENKDALEAEVKALQKDHFAALREYVDAFFDKVHKSSAGDSGLMEALRKVK